MLLNEIEQVESLVGLFPKISVFLGDWLAKETRNAQDLPSCHVFLGYLASPYGRSVADEASRMFSVILSLAPDQQKRLRKKIIQASNQAQFEAVWFELEVNTLLLKHGYKVEIEPLGGGPDLKTVIAGYETYIEVKKLQHDAETEFKWKNLKREGEDEHTWPRTVSANETKRQKGLYDRYLEKNQFPVDGLHVLVMDTFKQGRADSLMTRAWKDYCESVQQKGKSHHPINSLILGCCRKGNSSWLHDWTTGVIVLQNPNSPLPANVAESLTGILQEK